MDIYTIQDLFQGQMDYIFFFQGLAFFLVLLVCCLFRGDVGQRLPWRWLGLFALAQGIAAWLSLVAINLGEPDSLKLTGGVLYLLSWFFLTEFGRSGMNRTRGRDSGLWLMALLLMVTALGGLKGWDGITLTGRYTLGLIGGLWATATLFIAGRSLPDQNRGSGLTASISLGLFAITTALSPPRPLVASTSLFNQDLFMRFAGVPLDFIQGVLAFGLAAGIYGYLAWRDKVEELQDTRYRTRYMFTLLATLSIILGVGSALTLYLADWANSQHERLKDEVHAYAAIMVNRLNTEFRHLDEASRTLSETSWLPSSVRYGREEDLARVNALLDQYNSSLEASVCYLMDAKGKTIASSNRQAPDSFVGHSYAFRPYFKQAINRSIGRYFAVGVTSKVPGYYVSSPVGGPKTKIIRGVAVIKVSMDKITKEMKAAVGNEDSMMCLVDQRGIVFLASNPEMVFKSLWPVEEADRPILQEQYGKDRFPAIFPERFGDGAKVDLNGRNYLVSYAGTIHTGWSVFFFRPVERLGIYRLTGILVACLLAVIALVSLGSNFYLKEHTLSAAGRFRAIFESAPEGVVVIDPDTLQIIESNRFIARTLGYAPKELRNLKLDDLMNLEPHEIQDQLKEIIQGNGGIKQHWQVRHKDGTIKDLEIIGAKLRQGNKDIALICGRKATTSPSPSSPRGERQDRFLESPKPHPPETPVAGKLDEFSNIFSTLILQTEMTLDDLPADSSASRNLQEMLNSAIRAKDLVRNLAAMEGKESSLTPITATSRERHILLVDDEPQLCRLEEKLLMRLGYRVTSFTDSQTALEAFQKNPEAFDLVITDCTMSHLSGLDLAQELLRLRPDLPIILAIGLGEKDQIPRAQKLGIKECLEKPILCGDLGKTIRRLLQEQKLVRCL